MNNWIELVNYCSKNRKTEKNCYNKIKTIIENILNKVSKSNKCYTKINNNIKYG
jgi:hypothetical protein